MQAVNYYIVVENIKVEQKKVAGLILTDRTDTDNRYLKARIISTGNLVKGVQEGDIVYYDRHAGHSIQVKEGLYKVIQVGDVVLVE